MFARALEPVRQSHHWLLWLLAGSVAAMPAMPGSPFRLGGCGADGASTPAQPMNPTQPVSEPSCGRIYERPCASGCSGELVPFSLPSWPSQLPRDWTFCWLPPGQYRLCSAPTIDLRPVTLQSRADYYQARQQIDQGSDYCPGPDTSVHLDLGGEGPHELERVYSCFAGALNLNAATAITTSSTGQEIPIPNHIPVDFARRYPICDNSIDLITLEGAPLTAHNVHEISRMIRPGGLIWVTDTSRLNDLLNATNGSVVSGSDVGAGFSQNTTPGTFVRAGTCGGAREPPCRVHTGYEAACFFCPWSTETYEWRCAPGLTLDRNRICNHDEL
jgi:hypothetical protein